MSQNSYRSLLPGATYIEPPKPMGLNPLTASKEEVFALLSTAPELNGRYLQQHFQGLGKDTADELSARLLAQPNEKNGHLDGIFGPQSLKLLYRH